MVTVVRSTSDYWQALRCHCCTWNYPSLPTICSFAFSSCFSLFLLPIFCFCRVFAPTLPPASQPSSRSGMPSCSTPHTSSTSSGLIPGLEASLSSISRHFNPKLAGLASSLNFLIER
ncbi:uncharacterized protein BP01DRAFT_94236 [Aspergillus saccharolyticus JOP 1030-1]|uniref:Uncharacterized protein n=1 Tax=Aspergillus saccharolyticus JOP 1030-1 TaxID=1450539 RepID=A0A318ZC03_9EURO|nr:hypothetical protein BP01DRAFT_94236 [Aspergillus saccharolyticus JOP 1030-1]PYH43854.1 hypothetical protein BP01DRAFT_94236 [Aspergillus saccharolyticus JOP 1030-1]